jgi:hypothetical protein
MSDGETFDLVVRGVTRRTVKEWAGSRKPEVPEGFLGGIVPEDLRPPCRELVLKWEREERDVTSYTDESGATLHIDVEGDVVKVRAEREPEARYPFTAVLVRIPLAAAGDLFSGLPGVMAEGDFEYEKAEDDQERDAILGAAPASTASATTRVVMPGPEHSPEPSPEAVEHVKRWAAANYGMLISTYDVRALLSGLPRLVEEGGAERGAQRARAEGQKL